MRGSAMFPIVIAAGGTGGHFFPAEALASELLVRGRRARLVGNPSLEHTRIDVTDVPEAQLGDAVIVGHNAT